MGDLDVNVQTNVSLGIGNISNPIQIRVRGKNPACIKTTIDVVDGTIENEIEPIEATRGYRQVGGRPEHRFPHET